MFRLTVIFVLLSLFAFHIVNASDEETDDLNLTREDAQTLLRVKRAGKKSPGFFRTLFSMIAEQYSDTKNTFGKVNEMINDNFLPENAEDIKEEPSSRESNGTTTEAPYKITRTEFNKIIRRNLRGLVRLFNIELQDALKQSKKNQAQYDKELSKEISKYL